MKISLSIVTFNNSSELSELFTSIQKTETDHLISDIYVVDNASTDSTKNIVKAFQKNLKNLHLIENQNNKGFGAAHNQAILAAQSSYHVICNPDIKFKNNSLKSLIDYLEIRPQIGLVAPKVVYPNGNLQLLNRRFPTLVDLAVQRLGKYLPPSFCENRTTRYLMKDCDYSKELDVPCLSGCFLLGRTGLLKSLGGFDLTYFLYFEDFDLCQKIRESNYRTVYSPVAEVEHLWARNSHKKWIHTWYFITSAFKFFNRWGWKLY